jgi:hypothetical protein
MQIIYSNLRWRRRRRGGGRGDIYTYGFLMQNLLIAIKYWRVAEKDHSFSFRISSKQSITEVWLIKTPPSPSESPHSNQSPKSGWQRPLLLQYLLTAIRHWSLADKDPFFSFRIPSQQASITIIPCPVPARCLLYSVSSSILTPASLSPSNSVDFRTVTVLFGLRVKFFKGTLLPNLNETVQCEYLVMGFHLKNRNLPHGTYEFARFV